MRQVSLHVLTLLSLSLLISTFETSQDIDLTPCLKDKKMTNGCTIPWGIDFPYQELFLPACQRHDVCYTCGTTHGVKRKECDESFYQNMLYLCNLKESMKKKSNVGYSISSLWNRFVKELKGVALVGAGLFRWISLETGNLTHCLNGANIYHDAVRHFAMKSFHDYKINDCKMPCAEYMVDPKHGLNSTS